MKCPLCEKECSLILQIKDYPVFANAVEGPLEEDNLYSFSVSFCNVCAFGFQHNPPAPEELYTRVRAPSGVSKVWQDHYQALIRFTFHNSSHHGKSALDVGAGHGFLSRLLLEESINAEAIDLNPGERLLSLGIPVHQQSFGVESALEKQYDFLFISHVIEHVNTLNEFLNFADSVLAPDGQIIFSIPDSLAGLETKDLSMFIPEHTWYFSERSLEKIFIPKGLEIEEIGFFSNHSIFARVRRKSGGQKNWQERASLKELSFLSEKYCAEYSQATSQTENIIHESKGRVLFFGAHSMTLNLIVDKKPWKDLNKSFLLIDNDPFKQGKRLSGTPLKIISPEKANLSEGDTVIIPKSPYAEEMEKQVLGMKNGLSVTII